MAKAGYCTHCHRADPITHADMDRAPGYWRDKHERVEEDRRDLDAEPCGEDCYLAPVSEYQGATYPYTMHDRDPPYTGEPGCCRQCGLVRPVTETDAARDLSWWQSHMRPDTFKNICGKHCHMVPIIDLVPRVMQQQRRRTCSGDGPFHRAGLTPRLPLLSPELRCISL